MRSLSQYGVERLVERCIGTASHLQDDGSEKAAANLERRYGRSPASAIAVHLLRMSHHHPLAEPRKIMH
jgi:hypothetical protein